MNLKIFTLHFLKKYLCLAVLVFTAARGLSLVVASRAVLWLQCAGFPSRWLLLLWNTGFRVSRLQQL